jgi:hypothetical protein
MTLPVFGQCLSLFETMESHMNLVDFVSPCWVVARPDCLTF